MSNGIGDSSLGSGKSSGSLSESDSIYSGSSGESDSESSGVSSGVESSEGVSDGGGNGNSSGSSEGSSASGPEEQGVWFSSAAEVEGHPPPSSASYDIETEPPELVLISHASYEHLQTWYYEGFFPKDLGLDADSFTAIEDYTVDPVNGGSDDWGGSLWFANYTQDLVTICMRGDTTRHPHSYIEERYFSDDLAWFTGGIYTLDPGESIFLFRPGSISVDYHNHVIVVMGDV